MKKNNLPGFAMIEVLVSMGLISLVLLSLLIYQISLIKSTFQINLKAIAHMQLVNFSEMLLVNTDDVQRNTAFSVWNKVNNNLLPQGDGVWNQVADHQCEITVHWFYRKSETESINVFC